jgi:hypothetical protein
MMTAQTDIEADAQVRLQALEARCKTLEDWLLRLAMIVKSDRHGRMRGGDPGAADELAELLEEMDG